MVTNRDAVITAGPDFLIFPKNKKFNRTGQRTAAEALESWRSRSSCPCVEEVQIDEMWSYVGNKAEPRWLWHVTDHRHRRCLSLCF
jgi:hypothetical protein